MVLSNNALYNAYIFDADYHLFMISDIKPSSKQKAWLATNTTDQVSACFTGRNNVFPYFVNPSETRSYINPLRFRDAETWSSTFS